MKKLALQGFYIFSVIILFVGATLPALAQFTNSVVESGGLYTALAKDAGNNLYVTRVTPGTAGATYEVEKYTNGTGTPAVIYTGLTHELGDYPWGLAVTSTGNVYISTDFTTGSGAIIELTFNSGADTYTSSTFQTGRYFTALAVDASDNLYDTEYDVAHTKYAVVKYAANSAANSAGTNLYDNLTTAAGYTYPTGLAVAANGDVYVADAFSNTPSITDGGHVYKLTAASSYAAAIVSAGMYSSALTLDASGNLYSSENSGSGYQLVKYPSGGGAPSVVFTPLHTNGIYYPWGIAVYNSSDIFVVDGDDGTHGGEVIKLLSSNANLSNLTISSGALTPVFAAGTTSYTEIVTTAITSVTVTPTAADPTATVTVALNGGTATTVTSGAASPGLPLNAGANTIATKVAALDGVTTKTYTITVGRGASNPYLSHISISSGTLTPVSGTPNYTVSVANATTSVTVTPTTTDPNATIKVNGAAVASGTASSAIPLIVGSNTITILSTAQNGVTTQSYIITVTRAKSSNTYLSHLSLSSGTLVPVTGTPNYTVTVTNATASVKVTATTADPTATLTINGTSVASGTASAAIPLSIGANTITVVVTAQDGVTTQPYVITVTRPSNNAYLSHISISSGTLTPVSGSPNYTVSVAYAVASVTVTPATADPNATVTVNGTAVLSGTASAAIPLIVGSNTITVVVTAQDGVTTQPYVITVTRAKSSNAYLSELSISSGTLTPVSGSPNFTATVATTTTSVTATTADPNATVTVNGTAVTSGKASAPIPLSLGSNTITVVVTAQDGVTTQPYVITVTRLSNNAYLSELSISSGTLTPVSGTPNYTVNVTNATASVTVTPTTADPTATVTVNGTAVTSGTASAAIPLAVGSNTINIAVTAQDGVTTQPYIITVTRAKSSNAYLSHLAISSGTLTPVTGTPNYTVSVTSATTSVKVTATTADPTATLTINGTAVASGTASAAIPLSIGANTITIVVTAQDGTTTQPYVITVGRGANNAYLSHISISSGTLTPVSGSPNYTVNVTNATTSVTVTPTATDPNATVKVNGAAVTSGTASAAIPLIVGANTITIVVTAQDGVTNQPYVITVTRAKSSNAYLSELSISSGTLTPVSGTPNYTDDVANAVTSVTVTATTADPNATETVNGTTVTSGTASAAIPLAVGSNTINIVVTAQDGVTTQPYVITVTRAASRLTSLYLPIQPVSVIKPADNVTIENDGIMVHQGVSPNGDGLNDFLLIDGLVAYPDNKVTIIDRSGAVIFEAKGYDNATNVFDGHSSINGKMQQPGTYFYSLDYSVNGQSKHKTGYIILKY